MKLFTPLSAALLLASGSARTEELFVHIVAAHLLKSGVNSMAF